MLLDISVDNNTVNVISLPRDLLVDVPACTDSTTGQHYAERQNAIAAGNLFASRRRSADLSQAGPGAVSFPEPPAEADTTPEKALQQVTVANGTAVPAGARISQRCLPPAASQSWPGFGPRSGRTQWFTTVPALPTSQWTSPQFSGSRQRVCSRQPG